MNLRIQIFAAPGDGLGCRTGDPLTQGRPLRPAVTRELDLTGGGAQTVPRGAGGGGAAVDATAESNLVADHGTTATTPGALLGDRGKEAWGGRRAR
jgi:hypothetical protein